MRLAILHFTPPGVIGGVEQVMQEHITRLRERGFDIAVIAGRQAGGVHVIPELDAAGEESRTIEAELADGRVTARFEAARESVLARLEPLVAQADRVIVHNAFTLHFSLPLTAALWQLAEERTPGSVLAWSHDLSWSNELYIPTLHSGYPWNLLREPAPNTRYVTVSEQRRLELATLWRLPGSDISVIPNGIDPDVFLRLSEEGRSLARRYRLYDRDAVILLPVRVTRRKNIEAGIRAVRALKNVGMDVRFVVTGPTAPHHPIRSAQYLDELKALRAELGLDDEVVFLAEVLERTPGQRTLGDLYALADILLLPSASEGFGLPILEAGLARVPVALSDIPIFREVSGGYGATFSLDSSADRIAESIMELLHQESTRLRRRVLSEYSWDRIVDERLVPLLTAGPEGGVVTE
ncbi:MAG: glycosyltransferase family 4 protein [Chloroflexota bacterium]